MVLEDLRELHSRFVQKVSAQKSGLANSDDVVGTWMSHILDLRVSHDV